MWSATRRGVERLRWRTTQNPEFSARPLDRFLEGLAEHEVEHFAKQHLNEDTKSALEGAHGLLVERGIARGPFARWLSGLSGYAREGWDAGDFAEVWPEAAVQIGMASPSDPAHPAYAVGALRWGLPYQTLATWAGFDQALRVRRGIAELLRCHAELVDRGVLGGDFEEWLQTLGGWDAVIALLEADTTAADTTGATRIADDYVQARADLDPYVAVDLGRNPDDLRLPDFSPQGLADRADLARRTLAAVVAVDLSSGHDPVQRRLAALLTERLSTQLALYHGGEPFRDVGTMRSPPQLLPTLFTSLPTDTDEQWHGFGQRLARVPEALAGYRATLAEGIARGLFAAPRQVSGLIEHLTTWTAGSSAGLLFGTLVATAPAQLRGELQRAAEAANEELVALRDWLRETYAPAAAGTPDAVGLQRYRLAVREWIGQDMSQEELEEAFGWACAQLGELYAQMRVVAERIAPGSDPLTAMAWLDQHGPAVEGQDNIRDWLQHYMNSNIDEMDAHFDFTEAMRRVQSCIAPEESAGAPPHYFSPSEDGTRPGRTWLPVGDRTRFPLWNLKSNWCHEGVPGHHLQFAHWMDLARRGVLSAFQVSLGVISANTEGWAQYAERLMDELGYFSDPADRMGYLNMQMLRTLRVVVDIGLHCGLRYPADSPYRPGELITPDSAVEFMGRFCHFGAGFLDSELTRYLGMPAQAIGYKLGERAWLAGRAAAQANAQACGVPFDLKAFHSAALSLGSLGLTDLVSELASAGWEPAGAPDDKPRGPITGPPATEGGTGESARDVIERVRAAVATDDGWQNELADQQRQCVQLCYVNDLSQQEAADRLGLSVKTVRVHLMRARTNLQPWIAVHTRDGWQDQLSEPQRRCVQLCFIDGFSPEQTAEQLHLSVQQVRQHLAGARKRLRAWIAGAGATPDPVKAGGRTRDGWQDYLTRRQRQCVELCWIGGHSHQEAAEELHLSAAAIREHLAHARTGLQAWLATAGPPLGSMRRAVRADPSWRRIPELTDGERDCLRLRYGEGMTVEQVGARLEISERTLDIQLSNVHLRLAVWLADRLALAREVLSTMFPADDCEILLGLLSGQRLPQSTPLPPRHQIAELAAVFRDLGHPQLHRWLTTVLDDAYRNPDNYFGRRSLTRQDCMPWFRQAAESLGIATGTPHRDEPYQQIEDIVGGEFFRIPRRRAHLKGIAERLQHRRGGTDTTVLVVEHVDKRLTGPERRRKHVLILTNLADPAHPSTPDDNNPGPDVYVLDPLVHGPVSYQRWLANQPYRVIDAMWAIDITADGQRLPATGDKPTGPINGPPADPDGPMLGDPGLSVRGGDGSSHSGSVEQQGRRGGQRRGHRRRRVRGRHATGAPIPADLAVDRPPMFGGSPHSLAAGEGRIRALPEHMGDLEPDLTIDVAARCSPDQADRIAAALGARLGELGWRDPVQVDAVSRFVATAGRDAIHRANKTRAPPGDAGWIGARVTVRISQASPGPRKLHVSVEAGVYSPIREPLDGPIFRPSIQAVSPDALAVPASASRFGVTEWGEVWAAFVEQASEPALPAGSAATRPQRDSAVFGYRAAKAALVRALYDDLHIRVYGWDKQHVTRHDLAIIDRAIRDAHTEFRGMPGLRDIFIGKLGGTADGVQSSVRTAPVGNPLIRCATIAINEDLHFLRRDETERLRRKGIDQGFRTRTSNSLLYDNVFHDAIHAVHYSHTNADFPVDDIVRDARRDFDTYRKWGLLPGRTFDETSSSADRRNWFQDFVGYANKDIREKVAEGAFQAARGPTLPLPHAAWSLYWWLVIRNPTSAADVLAEIVEWYLDAFPHITSAGRRTGDLNRFLPALLHVRRMLDGRGDAGELSLDPRLGATNAGLFEAVLAGTLQDLYERGKIPPALRRFADRGDFRRLLAPGVAQTPWTAAAVEADCLTSGPEYAWQLGGPRWLLQEGDNDWETVELTTGGCLRRIDEASLLPDSSLAAWELAQVTPVAAAAAELLQRRGEPDAADAAWVVIDADPTDDEVDAHLITLQVIDDEVLVFDRDVEQKVGGPTPLSTWASIQRYGPVRQARRVLLCTDRQTGEFVPMEPVGRHPQDPDLPVRKRIRGVPGDQHGHGGELTGLPDPTSEIADLRDRNVRSRDAWRREVRDLASWAGEPPEDLFEGSAALSRLEGARDAAHRVVIAGLREPEVTSALEYLAWLGREELRLVFDRDAVAVTTRVVNSVMEALKEMSPDRNADAVANMIGNCQRFLNLNGLINMISELARVEERVIGIGAFQQALRTAQHQRNYWATRIGALRSARPDEDLTEAVAAHDYWRDRVDRLTAAAGELGELVAASERVKSQIVDKIRHQEMGQAAHSHGVRVAELFEGSLELEFVVGLRDTARRGAAQSAGDPAMDTEQLQALVEHAETINDLRRENGGLIARLDSRLSEVVSQLVAAADGDAQRFTSVEAEPTRIGDVVAWGSGFVWVAESTPEEFDRASQTRKVLTAQNELSRGIDAITDADTARWTEYVDRLPTSTTWSWKVLAREAESDADPFGFAAINQCLRESGEDLQSLQFQAVHPAVGGLDPRGVRIGEIVELLDRVQRDHPVVPDIVVWTCIKLSQSDASDPAGMQGKRFHLPGYTNAFLNSQWADNASNTRNSHETLLNWLPELRQQGYALLCLRVRQDFPKVWNDPEMLLGRGIDYVVTHAFQGFDQPHIYGYQPPKDDHIRGPPGSPETPEDGDYDDAPPEDARTHRQHRPGANVTGVGSADGPDMPDGTADGPTEERTRKPQSGADWFFDTFDPAAHTDEMPEPVKADATADGPAEEPLISWWVWVDPERPAVVGEVLAEQMRLLGYSPEEIAPAVEWANDQLQQRIRIQSVPRVTVGVLASGDPLLIFHGHRPLPDQAVTPARVVAPNEQEKQLPTDGRAAALWRFVEEQLPDDWDSRGRQRARRLVGAVVGDFAGDQPVTVRIGVRDDVASGEAVSVVVEGSPRAFSLYSFQAVKDLALGSTSWWVEELPGTERPLRRLVFEVPARKPPGLSAQFWRDGTAYGVPLSVRQEPDGTPWTATPPELVADVATFLSRWMAGDWVRHWCAVARHHGRPITTARGEVTDSTTFVQLHGEAEHWTLLRSADPPVPWHSSGPTVRGRLPVATRAGVDGAAAATQIAELARAEGIAEEHAGAAGVIAGVLVDRYLAASGRPGSLRLLLSDPVPQAVAKIGGENHGAGVAYVRDIEATAVEKVARIGSKYSKPVFANSRLTLKLVGPEGDDAYSFAGLLSDGRPPGFFGHPWFEDAAAGAGLSPGLGASDFVWRKAEVSGAPDEGQVAAVSRAVDGATVGLDKGWVHRNIEVLADELVRTELAGGGDFAHDGLLIVTRTLGRGIEPVIVVAVAGRARAHNAPVEVPAGVGVSRTGKEPFGDVRVAFASVPLEAQELADDARLDREIVWERAVVGVEERLAAVVRAAESVSDETARQLMPVPGEWPGEAARRFEEALVRLRESGVSEPDLQGFLDALARYREIGAEIRDLEVIAAGRLGSAVAAATEGAAPGAFRALDGFERAPAGAVDCVARVALRVNDVYRQLLGGSRAMQVPVDSITGDGAPAPAVSWLLRGHSAAAGDAKTGLGNIDGWLLEPGQDAAELSQRQRVGRGAVIQEFYAGDRVGHTMFRFNHGGVVVEYDPNPAARPDRPVSHYRVILIGADGRFDGAAAARFDELYEHTQPHGAKPPAYDLAGTPPGEGSASDDTDGADPAGFEAEIAAIRREIASLRSSSQGRGAQGGVQDEARLESLRARVERVRTEYEDMLARFDSLLGDSAPEKMRFHMDSESQWLAARAVDVWSLQRGVESLSTPGEDQVPINRRALRAFWNVIEELHGVRGATDPEDPNYVEIHGLSELQAALATAAPGQHGDLTDTAERIVGAMRKALAHDPMQPLCLINFTQLGSRPALARLLGYGTFWLNVFAIDINVRAVLLPEEPADYYAQAQADGYLETGTGDAWEDAMLHEICGHGPQYASGWWDGLVAGVRRADPVGWAERRVEEHLDAAFEALTAAGEIPPDRSRWESELSMYSRDPADPSKLVKREALAESAVYVLGNPGSDWRSVKYALYRALRRMPLLDSAEVKRFQAAEQLGVVKPHLLDPAELATVMTDHTDPAIEADATADAAAEEPLISWWVRVDPERPGAAGEVLAEQMRLLGYPPEKINPAVAWANGQLQQRIQIQSVPRVMVGVLASGDPLLIFQGHRPLPDQAVTPAGVVAPNELELPAGTSDRAAVLRDFVESQLPGHWGRRARWRARRLIGAVVRDLAADQPVTVRIGARGDVAISAAVSVVVEGRPRDNFFRAVKRLALGSTSWWVEQLPGRQTPGRRSVFEVAGRKPRGLRAQFWYDGTAPGLPESVREGSHGIALETTPPEHLADVLATSRPSWMAGDWVRHWCAVARHSGNPIAIARAEVTGSAMFVELHGEEGRWTLLRSAGPPVPWHSSGATFSARVPIATRHGVGGGTAAILIAEVARAEGIAAVHAGAAGVIAGVLVERYLAASGRPGSLRLLLSDPAGRAVGQIGAGAADVELDPNAVEELARIQSNYSEPVTDKARLTLKLVGPEGEEVSFFAGLLLPGRPAGFFGHPWFEDVAAGAWLPPGLSDFDFVVRQAPVSGPRDGGQVAAVSRAVRGATVGLDKGWVHRNIEVLADELVRTELAGGGDFAHDGLLIVTRTLGRGIEPVIVVAVAGRARAHNAPVEVPAGLGVSRTGKEPFGDVRVAFASVPLEAQELADDARLDREIVWERAVVGVEERLAAAVRAAESVSDETARQLMPVPGEWPGEAARRFEEALVRLRESGVSEPDLQGFLDALARYREIGAEIRDLEVIAAGRLGSAVAAATEGAAPGAFRALDGFERAPAGAVDCVARVALRVNDVYRQLLGGSRAMQVPVDSITGDGAPAPAVSWLLRGHSAAAGDAKTGLGNIDGWLLEPGQDAAELSQRQRSAGVGRGAVIQEFYAGDRVGHTMFRFNHGGVVVEYDPNPAARPDRPVSHYRVILIGADGRFDAAAAARFDTLYKHTQPHGAKPAAYDLAGTPPGPGDTNEPHSEREHAKQEKEEARQLMAEVVNDLAEWRREVSIDVDEALSSPDTLLDALVRDDIRLAAKRRGDQELPTLTRQLTGFLMAFTRKRIFGQRLADLEAEERAAPAMDPVRELNDKYVAAQELESLLEADLVRLLAESRAEPSLATEEQIRAFGPTLAVLLLLGRGLIWRNRGLAEDLVEVLARLQAAHIRVYWLRHALDEALADQDDDDRDNSAETALDLALAVYALARLPATYQLTYQSSADLVNVRLNRFTADEFVERGRAQAAAVAVWWSGLADELLPNELRQRVAAEENPDYPPSLPGISRVQLALLRSSGNILQGSPGVPDNVRTVAAHALLIKIAEDSSRSDWSMAVAMLQSLPANPTATHLHDIDTQTGEAVFIRGKPTTAQKLVYVLMPQHEPRSATDFGNARAFAERLYDDMRRVHRELDGLPGEPDVAVVVWMRGFPGSPPSERGLLLRRDIAEANALYETIQGPTAPARRIDIVTFGDGSLPAQAAFPNLTTYTLAPSGRADAPTPAGAVRLWAAEPADRPDYQPPDARSPTTRLIARLGLGHDIAKHAADPLIESVRGNAETDESSSEVDARRRALTGVETQMVGAESTMFAADQLLRSLCERLSFLIDPEPLLMVSEWEDDEAYRTRVEEHLADWSTLLTAAANPGSEDDRFLHQIRFVTAFYKGQVDLVRGFGKAIEPLRETFTGESWVLRDAQAAAAQEAYAAAMRTREDWVDALVELAGRLRIPLTRQQLATDQLVATARELLRAAYEQEYDNRELLEDAVARCLGAELSVQALTYFDLVLGVAATASEFVYRPHVGSQEWADLTNSLDRAQVAVAELIDAEGVPAKVYGVQDPLGAAVAYVLQVWRERMAAWSEAMRAAVWRAARDRFAAINRYLVHRGRGDRSEEKERDVALIDAEQRLQPIPEDVVLCAWLPADQVEVPDEPGAVIHLQRYLVGEILDTSVGLQSVIDSYRGNGGVLLFVRLPAGSPALGFELDEQGVLVAARDLDAVMTRIVRMDDSLPFGVSRCVFGYRRSDTGPAPTAADHVPPGSGDGGDTPARSPDPAGRGAGAHSGDGGGPGVSGPNDGADEGSEPGPDDGATDGERIAQQALARLSEALGAVRPEDILRDPDAAASWGSTTARWWDELRPREQRALSRWYPHIIGELEGIPAQRIAQRLDTTYQPAPRSAEFPGRRTLTTAETWWTSTPKAQMGRIPSRPLRTRTPPQTNSTDPCFWSAGRNPNCPLMFGWTSANWWTP